MKLKLLALAAYAAYEYDKRQVRDGKKSIFSGLRDLISTKTQDFNQDVTLPKNESYSRKTGY